MKGTAVQIDTAALPMVCIQNAHHIQKRILQLSKRGKGKEGCRNSSGSGRGGVDDPGAIATHSPKVGQEKNG